MNVKVRVLSKQRARLARARLAAVRGLVSHLYGQNAAGIAPAPQLQSGVLSLSIEALYRASETGPPEVARVCGDLLGTLMASETAVPDLSELARLDASLHEHARTVLRIGRGITVPLVAIK